MHLPVSVCSTIRVPLRVSPTAAQVLDVNDNSPVFKREHERLDRLEDHAQRQFAPYQLLSMSATDVDFGANGSVRYGIPHTPRPASLSLPTARVGPAGHMIHARTNVLVCVCSYSLVVPGANRFAIGESSGVLTVLAPLDREQQESVSLVVLAADRGTPPRTSTATVDIHLRDMNDNAPQVAEAPIFSAFEGIITAPIELGAHTRLGLA